MPVDERKFRIAFPVIQLPVNLGGKRAIVLFSVAPKDNPLVQFSTCCDIDGRIHQNVPLYVGAVRAASLNPVHFMEVESPEGPEAKPSLIEVKSS